MVWDDIRVFLAVARCGSVLGAATDLGVTPSTVSRRVTALEDALNVRLFERLQTGYELTPAGADLLEIGKDMEEASNSIATRVLGRDTRLDGVVRVSVAEHLVPRSIELLTAFRVEYPEIVVELLASDRPADIARREADVAMRIARRPPDTLVGRRLMDFAAAAYASNAYLERHDSSGLASLRYLGEDDGASPPGWLPESLSSARLAFRFDTLTATLAAVRAGLGVGRLPCHLGDSDRSLRRIGGLIGEPTGVWLLTHRDLRTNARIRAFLEFAARTLAIDAPLFRGRPTELDARVVAESLTSTSVGSCRAIRASQLCSDRATADTTGSP